MHSIMLFLILFYTLFLITNIWLAFLLVFRIKLLIITPRSPSRMEIVKSETPALQM